MNDDNRVIIQDSLERKIVSDKLCTFLSVFGCNNLEELVLQNSVEILIIERCKNLKFINYIDRLLYLSIKNCILLKKLPDFNVNGYFKCDECPFIQLPPKIVENSIIVNTNNALRNRFIYYKLKKLILRKRFNKIFIYMNIYLVSDLIKIISNYM